MARRYPADARLEAAAAIDSTFALERVQDAFDRVAAHGKRGKVVLDVAGER